MGGNQWPKAGVTTACCSGMLTPSYQHKLVFEAKNLTVNIELCLIGRNSRMSRWTLDEFFRIAYTYCDANCQCFQYSDCQWM